MDRSLQRKQLVTVIGALLLFAFLWVLPHKEASEASAGTSPADARINEAISVIEQGEAPMKGIMMLREVIEEYPSNIKALTALGYYSMQSGQYEKAIERFTSVLQIDPDNAEACYFLGEAHAATGNKEEAIALFKRFKSLSKDRDQLNRADKRIEELESTLTN